MFAVNSVAEGYIPSGPGQHNLAITAAGGTALTIPAGSTSATVQSATGSTKYTTDGVTAPSATVGMTLAAGATVMITGAASLANFKAFSTTATLDVEFFR